MASTKPTPVSSRIVNGMRADIQKLDKRVEKLEANDERQAVATEEVKTDVATVRTELADVKSDVAAVKADVAAVKAETVAQTPILNYLAWEYWHARRSNDDRWERVKKISLALAVLVAIPAAVGAWFAFLKPIFTSLLTR